jgi:NADH dehydrogenase [ubiquinone] 1 alpha subcomplex assembly factor 1
MTMPASARRILFPAEGSSPESWQIVNDQVMGGASSSSLRICRGIALFQGNLSLARGGGFASVRLPVAPGSLRGLASFSLRLRGDGRSYKLTLRTDLGGPVHQYALATQAGEWKDRNIPLQALVPSFRGQALPGHPPLAPARILSVGFLIAESQAGPFRLEVARIEAFLDLEMDRTQA